MSNRIITGKVRFSYANVWEAKAINEGDKEKFSVSLIIPKTDKVTLNKIKKAIEEAKQDGKGKWGGKIPAGLKLPLRDGDAERPDNEEYEGSYFLNANSLRKPQIIDSNKDEIMSKDEFYSGCYGRASLTFYAFNVSGNKGIACGLGNLQKFADGERLDGGVNASTDFAEDDDDLF